MTSRSSARWAWSGGPPPAYSTNIAQISAGSLASATRARSASASGRPPSGAKSSTSVCGQYSRSRSIGADGRTWSVSTALTHAPARPARSPRARASRVSSVPRTSASGRGTGAASSVTATWPAPSSSTSVTDLRWRASPNENASGDPLYLATVPPGAGTACGPCRWPSAA